MPNMSTTTVRIDDALKARIAAAADRAGRSAQAFMLDAITQAVDLSELNDEFSRIADERWAAVQATGHTVPWDKAKRYLEARSRGERTRKPAARKPAR
jgi:predicted transcriptional regulator